MALVAAIIAAKIFICCSISLYFAQINLKQGDTDFRILEDTTSAISVRFVREENKS